jgi:crossover junction endonuclease MUS81
MIIDNREKDLIKLLQDRKIEFKCENLELGDILFEDPDDSLPDDSLPDDSLPEDKRTKLLIIERKTVNDLMASIKDGRHREQKMRLLKKQADGVHIYYLIEGNLAYHKSKDTLYSSILNTMMRDNIKIIFTRNIEETITYLLKFSSKLDFCKKVCSEENKSKTNYLDTIKSCKKDNLTKIICYQAMLKQIPGVSTNCAESISLIYPTMNDLLTKYNELNDEDEKKYLLANIMIKKRKFGKKLSEKIYEFLI